MSNTTTSLKKKSKKPGIVADNKVKISPVDRVKRKKRTMLKAYLAQKNIIQQDIRDWSGLSAGAMSKLVSTGKGNKSTKKLVATFLQLSDKQFEALLKFEE